MTRDRTECRHPAFALRLKFLRESRGLSQRWVGREAGITSAQMSFLEAGRCCPGADVLARLADVLGVTMDGLWRGVGRCEEPPAKEDAS